MSPCLRSGILTKIEHETGVAQRVRGPLLTFTLPSPAGAAQRVGGHVTPESRSAQVDRFLIF